MISYASQTSQKSQDLDIYTERLIFFTLYIYIYLSCDVCDVCEAGDIVEENASQACDEKTAFCEGC